jgi:hypothetical protein
MSQADVLTEAERILSAMQANVLDLAHLEGSRDKLQSHLELAKELSRQQASFAASKQVTTSQLQQTLKALEKLVIFLRHGVKEHYGTRNQKLVDFGLTPFRGRPQRVQTPAPSTPPVVE